MKLLGTGLADVLPVLTDAGYRPARVEQRVAKWMHDVVFEDGRGVTICESYFPIRYARITMFTTDMDRNEVNDLNRKMLRLHAPWY